MPKRCDVTERTFADCLMRSCPEPNVIKRFGVGGVANVSIYVCRKCKYRKEFQGHGGVGCAYVDK